MACSELVRPFDVRRLQAAAARSGQVIVVRRDALLGETLYGLTLESFEPEYSSLGSQAGIVAGSWKTRDPINAWVHVAAIMLPILGNPDLTASLQVVD